MQSPLSQVDFNSFLQKGYIDSGGAVIGIIVALGLAFVFVKWRGTLFKLIRVDAPRLPRAASARATLASFVVNVLYQKPLADCSRTRWAMHFTIFWGFLLLALSTTLDALMNPAALPLPLLHPVRIAGNLGGALFIFGLMLALGRYVNSSTVRRNSSFGDFLFLGLLLIVALTGFFTEFLSDTTTASLDSTIFWSHLILVGLLLATAPFTKFAHAVARPTLLTLKKLANQKAGANA